MSKSTAVNEHGFKIFANGRCSSLIKSTSMGLHPLMIVVIKGYYKQWVWGQTFCYW